jgi:hypothetical protein
LSRHLGFENGTPHDVFEFTFFAGRLFLRLFWQHIVTPPNAAVQGTGFDKYTQQEIMNDIARHTRGGKC